jgi:TnsA endonuclease N terminal
VPVRKVKSTGRNAVCDFPSLKMEMMVSVESLLECDYACCADFEQHILEFEAQPLTIEYEYEGKQKHYTPDFLVKEASRQILVECKPSIFVDTPENAVKFEAARAWCGEHGYHFQVVTEQDIRLGYRLKNIKQLTRFARRKVKPEVRGRIYSILSSAHTPITLFSLACQVSPTDHLLAIPSILHMAFHHELVLPLNEAGISGDTPVSLFSHSVEEVKQ